MSPIMEEQSSNIPHQLEDGPSLGKFFFSVWNWIVSWSSIIGPWYGKWVPHAPIQKFKCSTDHGLGVLQPTQEEKCVFTKYKFMFILVLIPFVYFPTLWINYELLYMNF